MWAWFLVQVYAFFRPQAAAARDLAARGSPSGFQLLCRIGLEGAATVVCDRWSAYGTLRHILPGDVDLAYCRPHQRRDFRRVGTGFPSLRERADAWIERIGALFHLAWHPERPLQRQDAGLQALQQQLESALEDLFRTARRELQQVAAEWLQADASGKGHTLALAAARGKAVHSLLTHQTGLSVFATDPRVPPDNNAAERALRGPVIGRLTSFGSGSDEGAALAAALFSVFGTLCLAGLHPYAWMLDYLGACARNGGRAPQRLEPWLPWSMDAARKQALSQAPPAVRPRQARPTPAATAPAQLAPLARAT